MPRNHVGGKRHATTSDASGVWYANEVLTEMQDGNWPGVSGSAQFFVGSFAISGGSGTQPVTGVGFQPKAIVFWTSGSRQTSGTWWGNIDQMIGFTSGAAESYAVSGSSDDSVGTSNTARRIAAKAITFQDIDGGTWLNEADLQSFDAGGFTLNWTSWEINLTDVKVNFLAIGGAGVSAKVVNWTSPTSTGNKAVTTVGFQPDVVLHAVTGFGAIPDSATQMSPGFGAMDSAGGQWTNAVGARDGLATSDTFRYQRTNKTISLINTSGGTVLEEAEFVSMDAGGFTVNFTTAAASELQYISLCLSGVSATAGSFTSPTSATTKQVTGVGFTPGALLVSSYGTTASASVQANAIWGLSAADGTNERAAAQGDIDNLGTTEASSIWSSDKAVVTPLNSNPVSTWEEADLASFDAAGFTLSYTTAAAAAVENLYLALA